MWYAMRPVEMDFLETAPRRWVIEGEVTAPLQDVWRAYVDPTTWSDWFPGVRSALYGGAPPHGVGTVRKAIVGGKRFEETILAWEEERLWAYRIDRCERPLANAQLESTEFTASPSGGTRLRWVVACDPGLRMLRFTGFLFERVAGSLFAKALAGLERHLRES